MTCPVLAGCARLGSAIHRARRSKAASRYRPIAIDPEGLTVRDHCFTVNNSGYDAHGREGRALRERGGWLALAFV
jgi:hypothetical protein